MTLMNPMPRPAMTRAKMNIVAYWLANMRAPAGHAEGFADESSSFPSILVATPTADEAAEHGAEVVYRRETTLLGVVSDFAIRADLSHVNGSWCAADGSENALVVTFNQSNGGQEIEKDEKAFARQALPWSEAHFELLWIAVCGSCGRVS